MKQKKKPLIGILGRYEKDDEKNPIFCTWEEIRIAVVQKGGIPILLLPNQEIFTVEKSTLSVLEKKELGQLVHLCDGILFPGGSKWYEFEEWIYQFALKEGIPILGICLGMQMMVKMDLSPKQVTKDPTVLNHSFLNHHQKAIPYLHDVFIHKGTLLEKIASSSKIKVNSRHRYHVPKVSHLQISAIAPDGIIEAVEGNGPSFILGVQWHPESMLSYDVVSSKIFERFMKEALSFSSKKKIKNND